jgi:hypothetical protein
MAKVDWNTQDYEASKRGNFEALPKGRYLCQVEDTEMKPTKDKDGSYLEVTLSVILPKEFKGRKLWSRLNVNNKSEVAQRIGREQFNALAMAALGTLSVPDTAKLHLKKVVAHISIERGGDDRDDSNRVNGFEPYQPQTAPSGTKPAGPSETKPAAPPAAAPAAPKPAGKPDDDFEDDIPF